MLMLQNLESWQENQESSRWINFFILLRPCGWGKVLFHRRLRGVAISFLLSITGLRPVCLYFTQSGLLKTRFVNASVGLDLPQALVIKVWRGL